MNVKWGVRSANLAQLLTSLLSVYVAGPVVKLESQIHFNFPPYFTPGNLLEAQPPPQHEFSCLIHVLPSLIFLPSSFIIFNSSAKRIHSAPLPSTARPAGCRVDLYPWPTLW